MLLTEFFPWQPLLGNMGRMRAPPEYKGDMEKKKKKNLAFRSSGKSQ